ncbi:MAG: polyprenyl diphosphate synthase [Bryobacterales bacterium]|nr:polyprenyl diphosphate synthase [Bryobacterales bacterium]
MIPSTYHHRDRAQLPRLHVAIIMDGNGRWASLRGLPRRQGHAVGAVALRRVLEAAPSLGVSDLSVYAFSADNWKRPPEERLELFRLFERYLLEEAARCQQEGVEIRCIGWRHRLPESLQEAMSSAERQTAGGRHLTLRIALDYSSRATLAQAAAWATPEDAGPLATLSRQAIDYSLANVYGEPGRRLPEVDLLIRSGGQQRLSDFLLWECAYAELWFTGTLWPDFEASHLAAALDEFRRRQRTFGALSTPGATRTEVAAGGMR